jgi:hypothetical protein
MGRQSDLTVRSLKLCAASLMRDMIIGIHSWFISKSRYFYRHCDSVDHLSGGDLAFSLGFETLQNLKQARAHLQEAA